LPDIKNLFTVDLDGNVRTHRRAKSAAVTFFFTVCADWAVSLGVIFFSGDDVSFRAGNNAQMAFLAEHLVYFDKSLQNLFLKCIYPAQAILRIIVGKSSILNTIFTIIIRKFNP